MNLDIFESDYDQIDRQVFINQSDLYKYQPQYIVVFQCIQKLRKRFYRTDISRRSLFAQDEIARIRNLSTEILSKINGAKIIIANFMELNDGVFGQFANKVNTSFLFQIRRLNFELMELAASHPNIFITDLADFTAGFGHFASIDSRFYIDADMAFGLDFLPNIAKGIVDIINAFTPKANKCLILDLDNTLWGGVIGDDGIENIQIGDLGQGKAFSELQYWIRELQRRGVLLAVCSKNDESIAKTPFQNHPDMILSLADIAIFVANWGSKVDNIKNIKKFFNIGYDSIVFLDDNPYERGVVKHHLPEVTVPELPDDPIDYMSYLYKANLFETINYTEFDKDRTLYFQQEVKREQIQTSCTDEREFLKNLGMSCEITSLSPFNLPRVVQLLQRSNQFNLRTMRYTEEDLKSFSKDSLFHSWIFNVRDQFGSYGIVSIILGLVVGDELFLDTWVMSCRVLKRGIEDLALNEIIETVKPFGIKRIRGEYIKTPKNHLVSDHYNNLGFSDEGNGHWILDVFGYIPREHFILKE